MPSLLLDAMGVQEPTARRQVLIRRDSRRQHLDNLYEGLGLGVELDGQAYHPAEERWQDIGRDNAMAVDGILILRYGWADITGRPCQVAIQGRQRRGRSRLARCPSPVRPRLPRRPAMIVVAQVP